jgi:hypothetical protein
VRSFITAAHLVCHSDSALLPASEPSEPWVPPVPLLAGGVAGAAAGSLVVLPVAEAPAMAKLPT